MSSPWDDFFAAAAVLAAAGSVKPRLVTAYTEHLAKIRKEELPREIRDDFSELSRAISCIPPTATGESAVHSTVRKMSDQEAGTFAIRIVSMLGVLARTYPRPPQARGATAEDPIVLKLVAVDETPAQRKTN